MKIKITKRNVDAIVPGHKDKLCWDIDLPGFGLKVTPLVERDGKAKGGLKVYVFQYNSRDGRKRRVTIGRHGVEFTADEARRAATALRGDVVRGGDPAATRRSANDMPTLTALADRYLAEHAEAKKKPRSVEEDRRNLSKHVLPTLGALRADAIGRADVARFHHGMRASPATANRCIALLSKMMNLAESWGYRQDGSNPCRHVEKFREAKRERLLSDADLVRLGNALKAAEGGGAHPSVIAGIRLLLLTGCRRNEVLTLRWEHVDLAARCLRLPDSKTGAKLVPLGAAAIDLLTRLSRIDGNPFVLPGDRPGAHFVGLEKAWARVRHAAGMDDVRLHDLRHHFASTGAAQGLGLPVIGALLGHKTPAMTARYAHLSDDPRRAAADRIAGQIERSISGAGAEDGPGVVVELPRAPGRPTARPKA